MLASSWVSVRRSHNLFYLDYTALSRFTEDKIMLLQKLSAQCADSIFSGCHFFLRFLAFHCDEPAADLYIRHIILAKGIKRSDRARYGDIKAVAQLSP